MSVAVHNSSASPSKIELTDRALSHIKSYLDKQDGCQGVRFSVKKTGCSGLSYVIEYVDKAEDNDIVQDLNEHYILCIDKKSYPFLKGMKVDYVLEGLNQKFKFINPNQTGACGCGESFTVE